MFGTFIQTVAVFSCSPGADARPPLIQGAWMAVGGAPHRADTVSPTPWRLAGHRAILGSTEDKNPLSWES